MFKAPIRTEDEKRLHRALDTPVRDHLLKFWWLYLAIILTLINFH